MYERRTFPALSISQTDACYIFIYIREVLMLKIDNNSSAPPENNRETKHLRQRLEADSTRYLLSGRLIHYFPKPLMYKIPF